MRSSSKKIAFRYLDEVHEMGCSALDTAASYQLGGTERLLGQWMSTRSNRSRVILITKGANPDPLRPHRLTPAAITSDLQSSLRRLKAESIDLYLLHRDDPETSLEPVLEALTLLQKAGKIRAWGLSNWTHLRISSMHRLAQKNRVPSVVASSAQFSLVDWIKAPWRGCVSISGDSSREARAYYQASQIPVLAWSPLGQGFFVGPSAKISQTSLRSYGSPANLARRERTNVLAQKRGVSPSQIALAYLFNQSFPVHAVIAASTAEKMRNNLASTRLPLTVSEIRWLESGVQS